MPAIPDAPNRIKPSDLRTECMRCGGDGRIHDKDEVVVTGKSTVVVTYLGGCRHCSGAGKVFPRKVDI